MFSAAAFFSNAVLDRTNTGAKFLKAATDSCTTEPGDFRDDQDSTMTTPLRQQPSEQPPLSFVQRGQDAIDRLVIECCLASWLRSAELTGALINRKPDFLVCHDRGPHP